MSVSKVCLATHAQPRCILGRWMKCSKNGNGLTHGEIAASNGATPIDARRCSSPSNRLRHEQAGDFSRRHWMRRGVFWFRVMPDLYQVRSFLEGVPESTRNRSSMIVSSSTPDHASTNGGWQNGTSRWKYASSSRDVNAVYKSCRQCFVFLGLRVAASLS